MWRLHVGSNEDNNPLLTSLNHFAGRLTWRFEEHAGSEQEKKFVEDARDRFARNRHEHQHSSDLLCRTQYAGSEEKLRKPADSSADEVEGNIRAGVHYLESIQDKSGVWPADYGGPMFLMPGLIIALYVSKSLNRVLTQHHKQEMVRYLVNHQNKDGGFGLHIEGHSTMFGTVLSYVSLRILGMKSDNPVAVHARIWIQVREGATNITSWGKFWLAVLGCYSWDGLNPTPPEFWLLPHAGWTGVGWIHPGRYWCHCRQVYLPMSYLYGRRAVGELTPLVKSLREELYVIDYAHVDWNAARNQCAKEDLYYPHPWYQDLLWWGLYKVEPLLLGWGSWLRERALDEAMRHIHYEDENTRYIDIGPVNKAINLLCCYFEDKDSLAFQKHLARVPDYLWVAEDGMKMQGYCNSTLWDLAFAVQAITSTGLASEFQQCLARAHNALDKAQVVEDCPPPLQKWYRHISKGAWPFSTRDHGWPIADCSSEGLKAAIALAGLKNKYVNKHIPERRLFDCVNVILSYQNPSGGFPTYENTRSFHWLEKFNPAETFGDIMIDYDYVELTSACITGLTAFQQAYPFHRTMEIEQAIKRGAEFVRRDQRADGSWYGSWGVCFTYGAWFGCEAFAAVGEFADNSRYQRNACKFLLKHQHKDGGWGESYLSSQDKVYKDLGKSQVVHTSWALLALIAAKWHDRDTDVITRGVEFLISAQKGSGDWPQEHITGVFNRNCMISYSSYR